MAGLPPSILQQQLSRLPPDVSRLLYVKSLPYKITVDDLYDIFGKFGSVRQIRLGNTPATRGKAYVVYDDVFDAQRAVEHLNGFNIMGRYLVVLYHRTEGKGGEGKGGAGGKEDIEKRKAELEKLKQTFGVTGKEESAA
jgi:pre-mRNA branch site protein p14